jgi:putative FmdB family regulatory protein
MPIYAYRCASCGHAKDVLQKLSDPPLTVCPSCGASTFAKQVTAAGFQLKGSGWYATDFKGSGAKKADAGDGNKSETAKNETAKNETAKSETGKSESGKTDAGKSDSSKSGDAGTSTGSTSTSSSSSGPQAAAGRGGGCACH